MACLSLFGRPVIYLLKPELEDGRPIDAAFGPVIGYREDPVVTIANWRREILVASSTTNDPNWQSSHNALDESSIARVVCRLVFDLHASIRITPTMSGVDDHIPVILIVLVAARNDDGLGAASLSSAADACLQRAVNTCVVQSSTALENGPRSDPFDDTVKLFCRDTLLAFMCAVTHQGELRCKVRLALLRDRKALIPQRLARMLENCIQL